MKLLFERSRPGRGMDLLPPCDVPAVSFDAALLRDSAPRLPEIAEVDLGRHYTELADMTSLVRKYMIEEISKNYDGNKSSQFFYKDRDDKDPKI